MTRDFRRYWWAEATSTFGSVFTATATGVVAVRTFNASAAEVGVVMAAAILPTALVGMLSGVLADRLGRPRRLLIVCDGIAGVAVTTVAVGMWTGVASVWWLAALNLVLGCLVTLIEPVYFTHLGGLVDRDNLVRSRARLQSGEYGAVVLGRAAAGPLIAVAGGAMALGVDAASYLVSLACLVSLHAPDRGTARSEPTSVVREAAEGVREIGRHRLLRALVGFLLLISGTLGATGALAVPFLLRTLGIPTSLYGLMFAFTGLAGLFGSLVGERLVRRRVSYPVLTHAGFGGAVVAAMLLPAASGSAPTTTTLAVLGIALPVLGGAIANIGLTGVITTTVPEHLLGRVLAALKTATVTAQVTGTLLGGVIGNAVGVRPALWSCCLAALAGLLLTAPALRSAPAEASPVPAKVGL
jgi:MFS family permease